MEHARDDSIPEPPQPSEAHAAAVDSPARAPSIRARLGRFLLFAAILIVIAMAATGVWMANRDRQDVAEERARQALDDLGGVPLRDAQRKHVQSLMMALPGVREKIDDAIPHIARLTHLVHLDLSDTNVTDEHLRQLRGLKSLNSLALNNTQVGDAGVRELSSLPLEVLNLAGTRVSSGALETIGELRQLEILDLSRTKVTGNTDDFATLSNLRRLQWLVIQEVELTGQVVDALIELPALRRLTAVDSRIDPKSLERLREAKPTLTIELTEADAISEPILPATE